MVENSITLILIGDYFKKVVAHHAIPKMLDLISQKTGKVIAPIWVETTNIQLDEFSRADGMWVTPGSPYEDMEKVFDAIKYARETGLPFLGTCGGYQHALVEYARNALGYTDAGLSEVDPDCTMPVISPLVCAMREVEEEIFPAHKSSLAADIGVDPMHVGYNCSFGINPDYVEIFENTPWRIAARGVDGAIAAMELNAHPHFLGCAFQPERAALKDQIHPIVERFVESITQRP